MTWRTRPAHFGVSKPGSVNPRLDFSELLELVAFLSGSPLPDGLGVNKQVSITAGFHSVAEGIAIRKSVSELVFALPLLLDVPSTKWEGLSILQRLEPLSPSSATYGNPGAAGGVVVGLILSTSKLRPPS